MSTYVYLAPAILYLAKLIKSNKLTVYWRHLNITNPDEKLMSDFLYAIILLSETLLYHFVIFFSSSSAPAILHVLFNFKWNAFGILSMPTLISDSHCNFVPNDSRARFLCYYNVGASL
jgi:hypothetical protein